MVVQARPVTAGWTTVIDAAALDGLVKRGGAMLFDCRFDLADPSAGRARYRAGHLPGAVFLDLERDLSGSPNGRNGRHPLPARDIWAERLASAGLDRGRQAVAYDDAGGAFAARAWWLLRWLGHEAVAVLDGGVQAWARAGLPLTDRTEPPRRGDFVAAAAAGMPVVQADAIAASLAARDLLVIDARAPERFRGDPHPLDPVAGRIPGARNRFFRDNLRPDGCFKPAATLAAEYRGLIGERPVAQAVLQCGSGVTAAHDLLAMHHAGLPGAALYPGSWSEWISDPARPVERG